MNKYRAEIKGTLDYGEGLGTAGIDVEKFYEAETHADAKLLLKNWVTEQMKARRAKGFDGTVSAWLVTEQQLLDNQTFTVKMDFSERIVVDI